MRSVSKPMRGIAVAARLAASAILFTNHAFALTGDVKLPSPYVSRALDAVLLPINPQVRKAFKLNPKNRRYVELIQEIVKRR